MSAIQQELQSRLQGTNALIVRYQEALSLPTISASEALALKVNLRSLKNLADRLEVEFLNHLAGENRQSYRYRVITNGEVPSLAGIGESWAKLQNLYSNVYRSLTKGLQAAGALVEPELGFAYSFPGSVGVVVTLPPKPYGEVLLSESPVDEASDIVFNLIESRDIQGIARRLGAAPIQAMNEWLEVHARHHYGLEIEWRADSKIRRRIEVSDTAIIDLQATVQSTKTRETKTLEGLLTKVDIKNRSFRVKPDASEEDIEGTYGEGVIQEQHSASVPARYTVTIATVTDMVYTGKKQPKPEIILERLEPL